jgi:hypothetical protein
LRGKFSKQWKIKQKAYTIRQKLRHPFVYNKTQRRKARELAKKKNKKKKKNKTEDFHTFFHVIIPIIQEIWTDRCVNRNTLIVGGRIVTEYDSISKKVNHLYTMKEMVLPEDEKKTFNETLATRLEDTDQQIKKWLTRWKPVVEHSMKRVKELAQENSKPGEFQMDLYTLFSVYNGGTRTVENNEILTHLFNTRKASLASGVASFYSNISPKLARIVIQLMLHRHTLNVKVCLRNICFINYTSQFCPNIQTKSPNG